MKKKPKNGLKTRLLRLPKDLDEAIKVRAAQSNRSVTGQIIQELSEK